MSTTRAKMNPSAQADRPVGSKPLRHITVLDLSQGISGPAAGALLASQGARVFKIEPPGGDWIRVLGAGRDGMSSNAIAGNLGKRSLAIDATQPEGRDVLLEMASEVNVVLQNFRPGVIERLGLGFEVVRERNPNVVYCSISGFGHHGPRVGQPATDSVIQAFTGLAMINRGQDPAPRRVGMLIPDNVTALYAAQAISSALVAQSLHGEGTHLQISLVEACAALQMAPMIDADLFRSPQAKLPLLAPAGEFTVTNGWIMVGCLNQGMFERLCQALHRTDWLEDPRFAEFESRKVHVQAINSALAEVLAGHSREHWTEVMNRADVLCSAFFDYDDLRADAQVAEMGYFGDVEQAPYGRVSLPRLPGRACMSDATAPAPRCGEHSREILREFGFDAAVVDSLLTRGVVVQRDDVMPIVA